MLATYRQIKGKTNIKRLSGMLNHHERPEQCHCNLAVILQISGISAVGMAHHFSKQYSLIWCFDDGSEEPCVTCWSKITYWCLVVLRSGDCEGHSI